MISMISNIQQDEARASGAMGDPSRFMIVAFTALVLMFLPTCPAAYAEPGAVADLGGADEPAPDSSGYAGPYFALPVYLYGRYSSFGIQLGWQKGDLHLRMDLSVINEIENGKQVFFANPSLGVFFSQEWEARIRTYAGVAMGAETGLLNSFEGQVYTLNFITGAEWFVFERKAIYIELGSALAILTKEGAFNGGTVIGGGIKCFR